MQATFSAKLMTGVQGERDELKANLERRNVSCGQAAAAFCLPPNLLLRNHLGLCSSA
jgi:hypothetical protein